MTGLPRRGDVVVVDLGEPVGHEAAFEGPAAFERPAVVVSHDRLAHLDLVTVLAVTRTRLGWPSHVEVEPAESGLRETSHVQSEQVRTISTRRITHVVGPLPLATVRAVEALVRINLAPP